MIFDFNVDTFATVVLRFGDLRRRFSILDKLSLPV